jgi:hypothetical protein
MAKTIFRTNLQRILSFRAKLKKTGPNCKGFLKVGGYFSETGKTQGVLRKTARGKLKGRI